MFKNIFTIAIALVFLVTGIMSVVGAGKLANIGLEKVLGVENCDYRYNTPKPNITGTTPEYVCKPDTNRTKKDMADSLAMILISLPVSIWSYRKINKK